MGNESFRFRRVFLLALPRLSSDPGDGPRLSAAWVRGGPSLPAAYKQTGRTEMELPEGQNWEENPILRARSRVS